MPDPQELQSLLRDFHDRLRDQPLTVAVVGDIILDHHLEGTPDGRHPDIGVPVLRDATSHESCGGAANIAIALTRLGVASWVFGVVGLDVPGRQLTNLLERQPYERRLVRQRGWPTPVKHWLYERQADKLSLLYRVDQDQALPADAREQLLGEFRARCPARVDVVVLVDHGLGAIGPETLPVLDLARERGAKVVAIPRTNVLSARTMNAIVINSPEMRILADADAGADPRALAAAYARQYALDVFLTLLEEGIYFCPSGGPGGTLIEGYALPCAHWMGARDMATVIVALGAALDMGALHTARLANLFRHLVARQRGNGRVTWSDVDQFVGLTEAAPAAR